MANDSSHCSGIEACSSQKGLCSFSFLMLEFSREVNDFTSLAQHLLDKLEQTDCPSRVAKAGTATLGRNTVLPCRGEH